MDEVGVSWGGSSQGTDVGHRLPNAWGLYDMHGNVAEWCLDWYSRAETSMEAAIDPVGPDTGSQRVYRGGKGGSNAQYCRSASRGAHNSNFL